MPRFDLHDIVADWLRTHGYGGLCLHDDGEGCGCVVDDLFLCGEPAQDCEAAVLVEGTDCDRDGLLVPPGSYALDADAVRYLEEEALKHRHRAGALGGLNADMMRREEDLCLSILKLAESIRRGDHHKKEDS